MKNFGKLTLYAALALLVASIPATLYAAGHRGGYGPGSGKGPGGHFGGGFMAERIADRLDLSEGQREQIRTIRESYREEIEGLTESLATARLVVRGRIHSDAFDETAIREAVLEAAAVEADLAVLRARIASEVHQVLTPEQLAEAREMRERMRGFADEWRDHRRWWREGFEGPSSDGE